MIWESNGRTKTSWMKTCAWRTALETFVSELEWGKLLRRKGGHGKVTFVDTAMDPKSDNEIGNHPKWNNSIACRCEEFEKTSKPKLGLKISWLKLMTRISMFFFCPSAKNFTKQLVDKFHFWVVQLLVMLVLAMVFPKHCPVACWMLHSMHIQKGFAPYTCHLDTRNSRFLHATFLLLRLRMLMLKAYMNCWICSSRIAGNPELFQS